MTDTDIKRLIKTIEIFHQNDWWVADMPDIGVATQAKTLPELGVEVERIIWAHFETAKELGTDPFRCKRLSSQEIAARALDGWERSLSNNPNPVDKHTIETLLKALRDAR
jgi:hypothetical protein